jgi:anthranilate phosphoribosyltransferase
MLSAMLARLVKGECLSRNEATLLVGEMFEGQATDCQIAAALTALAIRGETVEELAGMASAMRARAQPIACAHADFIDTAGTGGSAAKTFNVSTAAAFVIAGAGLPVAKHGNRAATSRSGSADALEALGVHLAASPEVAQKCLNDLGICFMFAPLYHTATARVAGVRRELGFHTAFNLLGPMTNPAGAPFQIIGVWRRSLIEPIARALNLLGAKRAWVVHGFDGLDELTISDKTAVVEANDGQINSFELAPEDFGFSPSSVEHLRNGDAQRNAQIIRATLEGERRDEARSLIVMNAAAALMVGGRASDIAEAVRLSERSIDSGAACSKLDQLIEATN